MKKFNWAWLALLITNTTCMAQQSVHLHVGFLPLHSYTENVKQVTEMDMEFKNDIQSVNGTSSSKPVKKTVGTAVEKEIYTGKLYKDSLFSVKAIITKMTGIDGKSPIPVGTTIYSTASTGGQVTVDSMVSDSMDADVRAKLYPMMKYMLQQTIIPEHTVNTGDSFSFQLPLALPIAGMNLDFVINSICKLLYVADGLAYFDIKQTFTMKSESASMPIKASGEGTGSMTYDTRNNYYTRYETSYTMNMNFDTDGKSMTMKMENTTIDNVKIGKLAK